jgi:hypothetical protein
VLKLTDDDMDELVILKHLSEVNSIHFCDRAVGDAVE